MDLLDPNMLLALRHLVRPGPMGQRATSLPGGLVTKQRGRGLETADLRPFLHGDDPRHIDRNATARTGEPHIRTFQAERDRTLLLIADFRPSMLWGTRRTLRSVAAAEALCLAGWRAIAGGGRVGLIAAIAGAPIFVAPRGRDRGMIAVIGALTKAHEQAAGNAALPDPALVETIRMATRIVPKGGDVVLASALDTPGEAIDDALTALARRAGLKILRVTDPFEHTPPAGSYRFQTRTGQAGVASARSASPMLLPDIAEDIAIRTYDSALAPQDQPVEMGGHE